MDNNPICCLAELKIVLHGRAEGALVPQPVSSTQKERGFAGSGGGLFRRKAEEERTEKFTLDEKWPL